MARPAQRSAHATRGVAARGTMPLPALPPRRLPSAAAAASGSAARDVRTECAKTEGARTGGQTAPTALDQSRAHFAPARALLWRLPVRGRCRPRPNRRRAGLQLVRRGTAPRARRLVGQRHEIHAGPGASQRGCCCAARPAHTDSPAVAPEAAGISLFPRCPLFSTATKEKAFYELNRLCSAQA